jgi:cysteinyl-tRNA synthetase
LEEAQAMFRAALSDSFNTPVALDVLRDTISKTNVYINSRGKSLNIKLVERVAGWVGQMLRMFGLGEGKSSDIGWGQERSEEWDTKVGDQLRYFLRRFGN